MKKRLGKQFAKAAVFSVSILFLLLLSFRGSADNTAFDLRYEIKDDLYATTYDAPALYRLAFGEEPTGTLLEYLIYTSGVKLTVSDSVTSNAHASYSDGVLRVEADAYTYTAKNGARVTFLPESLHYNGKTLTLQSADGVHFVSVSECAEPASTAECTVVYRCELRNLPDGVYEELLNGAFREGSALYLKKLSYEKEKAEYDAALAAYEAYREALPRYDEDKAKYDEYCDAYALYERAQKAYDAYLLKKAAYDESKAKYEQYVADLEEYKKKTAAYEAYLDACDLYPQLMKDYRALSAQRANEIARLAALDSSYYYTETLDSMYVTLRGETVAMVVSQKEGILAQAGNYDGLTEAIDQADISSQKLEELLADYYALYRKESDEEKYAYYAAHYREILDNYCLLYSSLDHLFDNGVVRTVLKKNDRYERYKEFLSQLFILSTCLDDKQTLDTTVEIADGDRVCDLIKDGRVITDSDHAKPSFDALPALPEMPVYPEKVEKPTAPIAVNDPGDAPQEVAKPTPPEKVEAPKPLVPVTEPTPVAPLQMSATERRLCEAVESGELMKRTCSQSTLALRSAVALAVSVPERVTVSYYDSDRKTLLHVARVEIGAAASYGGRTLEKASDLYARYEFTGFVDANGKKIEDGTVFSSDISLYATYREIPITYTVTFSVNGKKHTSTYVYGAMPTPPAETGKASDARYHYVFLGWSSPVSYVTGNAEYTALYQQVERYYKIRFLSKGELLSCYELPYGATPSYQGTLPKGEITDLYAESFVRFSPALVSVSGDADYTAVFRKNSFGYDANGEALAAVMDENGTLTVNNSTASFNNGGAFAYAAGQNADILLKFPAGEVLITHENARLLAEGGALSVTLSGGDARRSLRVLYQNPAKAPTLYLDLYLDVSDFVRKDATFRIYEASARNPIFFTMSDGVAELSVKPNIEILLANEFSIGVVVGGNQEKPTDAPSKEPNDEPSEEVTAEKPSPDENEKGSVGQGGDGTGGQISRPTEEKGNTGAEETRAPTNHEPTPDNGGNAPPASGNDVPAGGNNESPTANGNASGNGSGNGSGNAGTPPSGGSSEGGNEGSNENESESEGDFRFEGGTISLDRDVALSGDPVTITAHPHYGYYLYSLSVKTVDGEDVPLQGMVFVMPNAPVVIHAEFAKKTYILRYLDEDGSVLLEKTLTFFDEEVSCQAPAGSALHVFDSWERSGSMEEGTVTYKAVYRDIVYADPDSSYERDYGGWRFRDYLPHAAILLGGGCVLWIFLCILRTAKRKNKKRKKK